MMKHPIVILAILGCRLTVAAQVGGNQDGLEKKMTRSLKVNGTIRDVPLDAFSSDPLDQLGITGGSGPIPDYVFDEAEWPSGVESSQLSSPDEKELIVLLPHDFWHDFSGLMIEVEGKKYCLPDRLTDQEDDES